MDDYYTSLLLIKYSQTFIDYQTLLSDDGKFAQELQMQEALISSLTTSNKSHTIASTEIGESSSSKKKRKRYSEEVGESSSSSSLRKRERERSKEVGESSSSSLLKRLERSKEVGESSSSSSLKKRERSKEAGESSSRFTCEICVEKKTSSKLFPFSHHNCSHKFCISCITKYIKIKLNSRKSPSITCPGSDCKGVLGIEECIGGVLPNEVVTLWDEVICESIIIPSSQRFYCPYKNCSALLMNDSDMKNMREAECPSCNRLFCVKCQVPWHSEFDCREFSRMKKSKSGREDLMLHELAKKKKWRRCQRCKFFVERKKGCPHMTCRCGFEFCYACGAAWSSTHYSCD